MTQQDMDTYNLVVGEVVSIDKLTDSDGNTLKCTIVGILNHRMKVIFTGKRLRQILTNDVYR